MRHRSGSNVTRTSRARWRDDHRRIHHRQADSIRRSADRCLPGERRPDGRERPAPAAFGGNVAYWSSHPELNASSGRFHVQRKRDRTRARGLPDGQLFRLEQGAPECPAIDQTYIGAVRTGCVARDVRVTVNAAFAGSRPRQNVTIGPISNFSLDTFGRASRARCSATRLPGSSFRETRFSRSNSV